MNIKVNKEVLVWARESIALNKSVASERTGISIQKITQLEEGEKPPTLEELKSLSKTYKRTIATLLLNNPPLEKPLPHDRRTVNSLQLNSFDEKTIMAVRRARALTQSLIELKKEAGISIPRFNFSASINTSATETAIKLRNDWNLNEIRELTDINQILDAYIEKIESLGIAVFQLSMTKDNIRGFSLVDDIMPIIGIKRGSENATSKIFTLFHEVGHILLNEGGICDLQEKSRQEIEKWCNSFAGEILIPSKELLEHELIIKYKADNNKKWAKKDLLELGKIFHAGPLAILRSLLKNKLTTQKFYTECHKKWNKPQFGKSNKGRMIPEEIIKEKGKSYVSLAFSVFDKNKISLIELADFLGIKLRYIPRTRQLLNAI